MDQHKAIIYLRVSTTKQVEKGASLETQEQSCLDWCFRNNIKPLQIFKDEGKSAKNLNRPEMKRMLEYINEKYKDIDFLVVYQMDRLSRESFDYFTIINALKQKNIEIRDTSSTPQAGDSDGLVQGINILIAEHDNTLKARRVKDNMSRKGMLGHRMHKAPYGLVNIKDGSGVSTVKSQPEISDKIAKILVDYSTGDYKKIDLVKKCRKIGLKQPNGKPMSVQLIDKILRQPLYGGLEKSSFTNNEYIDSVFPGIVPKSVYFTNQDLLANKTGTTRGKYKIINPDYPLRGFIYCSECKNKLIASASTGSNGKRYPRYACRELACTKGFISPVFIHEQFLKLLSNFTLSPKKAQLIKTIVIRRWNEDSKNYQKEKINLEGRRNELITRNFKAREKYINDELDQTDYNELKTTNLTAIAKIENDLELVNKRLKIKAQEIEYAIDYMGNVPKLWLDANPETKAMYTQMIFPIGIFYNLREKKFGTVKYSPLYTLVSMKKDPNKSLESLLVNHLGTKWNSILSELQVWLAITRESNRLLSIPA